MGVALALIAFIDAGTEAGYVAKQVTALAAMPVFAAGIAGGVLALRRPRVAAYTQFGAGILGDALTFSVGLVASLLLLVGAALAYWSYGASVGRRPSA